MEIYDQLREIQQEDKTIYCSMTSDLRLSGKILEVNKDHLVMAMSTCGRTYTYFVLLDKLVCFSTDAYSM